MKNNERPKAPDHDLLKSCIVPRTTEGNAEVEKLKAGGE